MGSGCTNSGTSVGVLFQKLIPDTQVQYTGPAIPALGICHGDLLSEVEAIVLQAIINYSTGVGITIPNIGDDLAACPLFTQYITCCGEACNDLPCLMDIIFKALCTLYTDITDLQTLVESLLNGPYDIGCLQNIPTNATLKQIVQELILEFCILQAQVAALQIQVNTLTTNLPTTIGNFMNTAITGCQTGGITKTGSGASFRVNFAGFAPIGSILMYAGLLTDFDPTGLGFTGGPMCGWALCNGNTHGSTTTVDMRGYKPVGVNDGTMGAGGQNAEVSNSTNPGQAYPLNGHLDTSTGLPGEIKHLLASGESGSAPHTHTVNDPGHSHVLAVNLDSASGASNANFMKIDATSFSTTPDGVPDIGNIHAKVRAAATGVTINAGGGSSAVNKHENRDPFRAVYFIQRVS